MVLFTIPEMFIISLLNELPLAEWALYHCLIPVDFIAYPIKLFDGLNLPALCLFQGKLRNNITWQCWHRPSLSFLFEFFVIDKLFFAYLLVDFQASQPKLSSTDVTDQYFGLLDLCLRRHRFCLLGFLAVLLAVSQMLLIRIRHETPSASWAMHHRFVFEKSWSLAIKLFYFLSSPISLALKELDFSLCEAWRFSPFLFEFFRLFIVELLNALRIVDLQAQQSEFPSADTADQSSRLLRLALVSLARLLDVHLFATDIDMDFQAFFIEGPAAEFASRQDLVFMYLQSLFIVAGYAYLYAWRFCRLPAKISLKKLGSAGTA